MDIFNRHSLTEALAARSPEVFFGVRDHFALKSLNRLHEETDRRDCRSINVTCKQQKKKKIDANMWRRSYMGNVQASQHTCWIVGLCQMILFHVCFNHKPLRNPAVLGRTPRPGLNHFLNHDHSPSFQGEHGSMFHIHITVGMLATSQDHVHILLHVLSSCERVLSFPSAAEL